MWKFSHMALQSSNPGKFNPKSANHDCSRRHSIIFHCFFFREKRLDVSSESSARQRIHMENQALFSSEDKNKKYKGVVCCNFVRRFKG